MSHQDELRLGVEQLTEALRSGGHDTTVTGFRADAVGTGQMGMSFRVHLEFGGDPDGAPATLVAKVAGGPPDKRATVAGSYRNEVEFYRTLAPTLAVRTPRCWYSWVSDDATDFLLLLDDLAPAVQGDQLAGCNAAEATAAVQTLAGLHGPRWCDPTIPQTSNLAEVDLEVGLGLGPVMEAMTAVFLDRFDGRLAPEDVEVMEQVPAAIGPWIVGRLDRFGPVHGDYRLDNLMFSPDGGAVTALDWQTVSLGLPARDLSYLLATSLEPEVRRSEEDRIVEAYHRALLGHGVTGYDLDLCRDDYRYAMLQAPLIIVLGCAVGTPTERGDEMFLAMTRRSCAAIRDSRTFDLVGALPA